jgi:hypothetical protein
LTFLEGKLQVLGSEGKLPDLVSDLCGVEGGWENLLKAAADLAHVVRGVGRAGDSVSVA